MLSSSAPVVETTLSLAKWINGHTAAHAVLYRKSIDSIDPSHMDRAVSLRSSYFRCGNMVLTNLIFTDCMTTIGIDVRNEWYEYIRKHEVQLAQPFSIVCQFPKFLWHRSFYISLPSSAMSTSSSPESRTTGHVTSSTYCGNDIFYSTFVGTCFI